MTVLPLLTSPESMRRYYVCAQCHRAWNAHTTASQRTTVFVGWITVFDSNSMTLKNTISWCKTMKIKALWHYTEYKFECFILLISFSLFMLILLFPSSSCFFSLFNCYWGCQRVKTTEEAAGEGFAFIFLAVWQLICARETHGAVKWTRPTESRNVVSYF